MVARPHSAVIALNSAAGLLGHLGETGVSWLIVGLLLAGGLPGLLLGSRLAQRLDAFPPTLGNRVTFYNEGQPAYDAKLEAIRSAQHHIHLEYFIFQPDASGRMFIDALAEKARAGVEVRLLYDAMGSYRLTRALLRKPGGAGFIRPSYPPCHPFGASTHSSFSTSGSSSAIFAMPTCSPVARGMQT